MNRRIRLAPVPSYMGKRQCDFEGRSVSLGTEWTIIQYLSDGRWETMLGTQTPDLEACKRYFAVLEYPQEDIEKILTEYQNWLNTGRPIE